MEKRAMRDTDGRFLGPRVNVESVPRLPTFPARWTLDDPRGRPYFVFWTSREGSLREGSLVWPLRMERSGQADAVVVTTPDGAVFQISVARCPLPRGSGTAILYRCPGCQRRRRYLYRLALVGSSLVEYLGFQCHVCARLRFVSQGCYSGVLARAFRAALSNGHPVRDPCPRHPWDPRAVSDPRMVIDEFPNSLVMGPTKTRA